MSFEISDVVTVKKSVSVEVPGQPTSTLKVVFEVPEQSKINSLLEEEGVEALLKEVVVSIDGVTRGGQPVDPEEAVPLVINNYFGSAALFNAFIDLKSRTVSANQSKQRR